MTKQFDRKTKQKVIAYTVGQDRVTVTLGKDTYPSDTEVEEDCINIGVFNPFWNADKELLDLTRQQAKLLAEAILELLEED